MENRKDAGKNSVYSNRDWHIFDFELNCNTCNDTHSFVRCTHTTIKYDFSFCPCIYCTAILYIVQAYWFVSRKHFVGLLWKIVMIHNRQSCIATALLHQQIFTQQAKYFLWIVVTIFKRRLAIWTWKNALSRYWSDGAKYLKWCYKISFIWTGIFCMHKIQHNLLCHMVYV